MKPLFIILMTTIISCNIFAQPKSLRNKKDTITYFAYNNKGEKASFSYDGKMGIIDSLGKVIIEAKYDFILNVFEDDGFQYHMAVLNKKDIVLNANGDIIIPPIFDDITPSINGFLK